jgi:hypothetical protein
MFTEPHSTKPTEDCVGWGLETTAETGSDSLVTASQVCSSLPITPSLSR